MAQKVNIILTDDLDETKTADETVLFSLDGTNYEIDLTNENADKLRASFLEYVTNARKVGKASKGKRASGPSTGTASAAEIREWARNSGMDVPNRGRITAEVRAQYNAAH